MPKYTLYLRVNDPELKKLYNKTIEDREDKIIGQGSDLMDSGFDLFVANDQEYAEGSYHMFNHCVQCRMEVEFNGLCGSTGFVLHPRSSTAKKYNLVMANSTGVIDASYRGDIMACMFSNITMDGLIGNPGCALVRTLPEYTRIVQICAPDYRYFKVILVDNLDDTSRGSGGFGSTGD